jgi:NADH-quinone oxidoreductase subunit G
MEFGMLNRGEHSEITTFVNKTVDSELSGNMIDLCPVGALTSKPFRYSARTWELSRRKSVSPHDSLGANLVVQVKGTQVMRILPLENDAINECWLSDRDRFAYEGLNSADRLTSPMIKQDGQWQTTDWQTALEYVAHGLRNVRHEHSVDSIAALATPYSTLEELSLLQKMIRGLGSENVDFRLRQSDTVADRSFTPWLGMSIDAFSHLKRVFVIGSFLRKDHPLLAAKLRTAVRRGAQVSLLHATDDDLLMPIANKLIAAPSDWLALLGEVAVAVAQSKQIDAPAALAQLQPSATAKQIAAGLLSGEPRAIMLGNAAAQHPQASQLHALAQWIATNSNAHFGYLTEAANTVGGYLAKALPANRNLAVAQFIQAKKAYVLLNVEPELDCANPQLARSALDKAEMVVVMSPYRHGMDYADVLLPIAPYSETSGTFVNAEGRAQGFNGTVKPLGDTRPAWKVLRVLGNLLGLDNFAYESSEDIRNEVLGVKTLDGLDLSQRLSNNADIPLHTPQTSTEIQRVADVPIYFSDAIARRSESLQQTVDAQAPKVKLSANLAQSLGVSAGSLVRVTQGTGSVTLPCAIESGLPNNVVRLAAAHTTTAALGSMFGSIKVEKA